ncbi:MAG: glutathione ABC transporter substrate-binding protein GsiB [Chloroflexi bacterium]|nr:glutathione ABC transporter substrate-binding protein GsiB [Chloroflexota bacterium]
MNRVDQFGALFEEWQRRGLDRRRFLRLVAVGTSASALSAIIAACGGPPPAATSLPATPTRVPSAASPAPQQTPTPLAQTVGVKTGLPAPTSAAFVDKPFLIAQNAEPDSLDIHNSTANVALGTYKLVYEGLVSLDEEMRVINLLAESWEPSADAKEFTFKIKKGLKFHDGEPFNAAAVRGNFERVLAPDAKLKRQGFFGAVIDHVESPDDGTVKLVAKQPFAAMIATIAHPAGGIGSPAAMKKWGADFATHPVGTGPYRFVEWARGDRIIFEPNPDYWNKALGPSVSRVIVKGIPEPSSLGIAVQTGDAQFAAPLNAPQAEQLRRAQGVAVTETAAITVFYVTLNNTKKPFDNKLVRQALSLGINREQVLKAADLGKGRIADSPLAPGVWGYHSVKTPEFNPQKAKELLAQAGYPNGFKSVLWTTAVNKDRAVAIQGQLKQIGVEIEVVQMESAALSAETAKPQEQSQIQMLMSGLSPSTGDADLGLRYPLTKAQWPPAGLTTSFFNHPQYEEYVRQGLTYTDEAKRKEVYAKAQELIMEEVPNLYLYSPIYFGAIRDNVGGVRLQADGVVFMRTAYHKK